MEFIHIGETEVIPKDHMVLGYVMNNYIREYPDKPVVLVHKDDWDKAILFIEELLDGNSVFITPKAKLEVSK